MLYACVTGNEVKENVHITLVDFRKKVLQVLVCAVSGSDLAVIGNIIACISERRLKAGIYPDSVAAKLPDVVELFGDTVEVAYAVAVGVIE